MCNALEPHHRLLINTVLVMYMHTSNVCQSLKSNIQRKVCMCVCVKIDLAQTEEKLLILAMTRTTSSEKPKYSAASAKKLQCFNFLGIFREVFLAVHHVFCRCYFGSFYFYTLSLIHSVYSSFLFSNH